MAIPDMIARAILHEHKYRPISGEGLLVGRQTMPFTVAEAARMVRDEGVAPKPDIDLKSPLLIDTATRYGANRNQINDVGFFSLFCDARFRALDVTDYEKAEIIHDMQMPPPDLLVDAVDFMWNGSCLANMFDPAAAMRNAAKMLRPGGRVLLLESGTPHHNAYTMFSPAWFFDFFALNDFADCKVYICLFEPGAIHTGPYDVFVRKRYESTLGQLPLALFSPHLAVINYVVAEKDNNSTWDKMPVQGQYRPDHGPYQASFARFGRSSRPIIRRPKTQAAIEKYRKIANRDDVDLEYVGSF